MKQREEASRHHDRKTREQGDSWWRRGKVILEREVESTTPRPRQGTLGGVTLEILEHTPDRGNGLHSELLGNSGTFT